MPLLLKVENHRNGLELLVEPKEFLQGQEFALIQISPQRLGLCRPSPQQSELLKLLAHRKTIPARAGERLVESLKPWITRFDLRLPPDPVAEPQASVAPSARPLAAAVAAVAPLITTPLGEMFMFTIEGGSLSLTERRTLLDWTIRPALRTIPGVADVNALGGYVESFEVVPDDAAPPEGDDASEPPGEEAAPEVVAPANDDVEEGP